MGELIHEIRCACHLFPVWTIPGSAPGSIAHRGGPGAVEQHTGPMTAWMGAQGVGGMRPVEPEMPRKEGGWWQGLRRDGLEHLALDEMATWGGGIASGRLAAR
jgi:hypothetical protein